MKEKTISLLSALFLMAGFCVMYHSAAMEPMPKASEKQIKGFFNMVRNGEIENARAFLNQYDFDINEEDDAENTPLAVAVFHDMLDMTRLLLDHGANPNVKNYEKSTPLSMAVFSDKLDIVRLLLDHGADVNMKAQEGNTALHEAIDGKNLEITRLLLQYGASKDIKNKKGKTPYDFAVRIQKKDGDSSFVDLFK